MSVYGLIWMMHGEYACRPWSIADECLAAQHHQPSLQLRTRHDDAELDKNFKLLKSSQVSRRVAALSKTRSGPSRSKLVLEA